jgi:replication-associated recombination protein RarA
LDSYSSINNNKQGGSKISFNSIPTVRGYSAGEVTSALQKAIRRSDDEGALFWAVELDRSGYGQYMWRRLLIMVSEDIGLANPELPQQIWSLYSTYKELLAWKNRNHPERLQIVHAVLLMARSPKSRMLDHACHVAYTTNETIPMPDYALCMHTGRGRMQGRGLDHWYSDAATLVNGLDLDDKWEAKSRELAYHPPSAKPAERTSKKNEFSDPEEEEESTLPL